MRDFKSVALAALLALTTPALAATSEQTDYNSASMSLTANGTFAGVVSFTVPGTTVTLDSQQVRPGNSFTVTIPVTNTADREITVRATAGTPSGAGANHLTVTPTNAEETVAVGGTAELTFTFTFDGSTDTAQAGQDVKVTFEVTATGVYETTQDATF